MNREEPQSQPCRAHAEGEEEELLGLRVPLHVRALPSAHDLHGQPDARSFSAALPVTEPSLENRVGVSLISGLPGAAIQT